MTDQPSYKTNDPRGWCGDPRRGAALGRGDICDLPPDAEVTLFVRRVAISSDGYDVNGTYWGTPDNLWWAGDAEGLVDITRRASDRAAAEAKFRRSYSKATFRSFALDDEQFKEFFEGYLEVIVDDVSMTEREEAYEDDRDARDICYDSVPDETRDKLRAVAREFWDKNLADIALLAEHLSLGRIGADLWMTKLGCSFTDRVRYGTPEYAVAKRLADAAADASPDVYVGDDGKVYAY